MIVKLFIFSISFAILLQRCLKGRVYQRCSLKKDNQKLFLHVLTLIVLGFVAFIQFLEVSCIHVPLRLVQYNAYILCILAMVR